MSKDIRSWLGPALRAQVAIPEECRSKTCELNASVITTRFELPYHNTYLNAWQRLLRAWILKNYDPPRLETSLGFIVLLSRREAYQ